MALILIKKSRNHYFEHHDDPISVFRFRPLSANIFGQDCIHTGDHPCKCDWLLWYGSQIEPTYSA